MEAGSLKKTIEQALGVPAKIRAGGPGSFRVLVDGEPVYVKKTGAPVAGREEIVSKIRAKMSSA